MLYCYYYSKPFNTFYAILSLDLQNNCFQRTEYAQFLKKKLISKYFRNNSNIIFYLNLKIVNNDFRIKLLDFF